MELDRRAKIHLEWMFENQPELVHQLLQENRLDKLEQILEDKYQQALDLTLKLKAKGQSVEEAFQNATDLILAPADGPATSDNPPEPLPLSEQKQVYARLDAMEEAEQRRNAKRKIFGKRI